MDPRKWVACPANFIRRLRVRCGASCWHSDLLQLAARSLGVCCLSQLVFPSLKIRHISHTSPLFIAVGDMDPVFCVDKAALYKRLKGFMYQARSARCTRIRRTLLSHTRARCSRGRPLSPYPHCPSQEAATSTFPICGLVKGSVTNPKFYYPIALSMYNNLPAANTANQVPAHPTLPCGAAQHY